VRDLDWQGFDVLVVDDEQDNLDAFRYAFRKTFRLHFALGGAEALAVLDAVDPAVVISDQRMPSMSGIELLRLAKEKRPDCVGVLLTAYADLGVLMDAVNSGAVDRYLQKPWDQKELEATLKQCITLFATVRENRRLREQLERYAGYLETEGRDPIDFGALDLPSAAMREVAARVGSVAPTPSHVLVVADEGSEQDIVARAIHVGSPREGRPFVRVSCGAYGEAAAERELFGLRHGAFEGAFDDRPGRAELADGGTLYLEGLHAPSRELQHRLLRLLERGELERIGETHVRSVSVRVIAAIPPEVETVWRGGGVSRELWLSLSVFPIALPPLRDRPEDVVPLAEHHLRKYQQRSARAAGPLSESARDRLRAHTFEGGVRELETLVERACILARGGPIEAEHLSFVPSSGRPGSSAAPARDLDTRLEAIEREELLAALARCGGNKAEVARTLGVQRTTLYYRLKKLGIDA